MTREEAKTILLNSITCDHEYRSWVSYGEANEIIDKIYDDFENRTCKNCKYLIKTKKGLLCSNPTNYDYIITDKSFGCNRFERKENEQDNQEDN